MMKLNFTEESAAQDMISLIMEEKGISAEEAVLFAINQEMYKEITSTGWAAIALDLWGHDDPEREWLTLKNSIIEVDLNQAQLELIRKVRTKEKVDEIIAIEYFLIFTMDSLGYHI